jgi:hypothetical protein
VNSNTKGSKKIIDLTFSPGVTEDDIERLLEWSGESIENAKICLVKIRENAKNLIQHSEMHGIEQIEKTDFYNIVAFTGDRGSGKTTAMQLFLGCLAGYHKVNVGNESNTRMKSNYKELSKSFDELIKTSTMMPVIDPSKMSEGEGEGILAYLVSGIYDKIKDIAEKCPEKFSKKKEDYRTLASDCRTLFDKIRSKTVTLKESVSKFSSAEDYLEDYSYFLHLRTKIYELVASYLKLYDDAAFLVIPIDDLDTNIRGGFDITRELQHYLSLPNIVIIMAVKVEQLSDLIEQRYIDEHKSLLSQNIKLDSDPEEMAVKFLQKLIPSSHRIQMAQLRLHTLKDVEVIPGKPTASESFQENKMDPRPLVDEFIGLIYKKTGIILTTDSNNAHPLIPLNLRALSHTMEFLNRLEPVNDDPYKEKTTRETGKGLNPNERKRLRNNLERVEHWLLDSISSNAVPKELADVFHQAALHPVLGFCAFLAHQIAHYNKKLENEGKLPILRDIPAVNNIMNADAPDKTICLGDVLFLLDSIMEKDSNEGYYHFAAATRMLFSLRVTAYLYAYEGDKPDYQSVSTLLGSMVVHPEIWLSSSGTEWQPRCDLGVLRVAGTDGKEYFLNGNDSKPNNKKPKAASTESVIWLRMFLVAPYRMTFRDYHKIHKGSKWSERVHFHTEDDVATYVGIHWMRFATSALLPNEGKPRVMWKLVGKVEPKFIGKLLKYRNTKGLPLPLNSIDVIHALTMEMNRNRLNEYHVWEKSNGGYIKKTKDYVPENVRNVQKDVPEDEEYIRFKRNLFYSYSKILERSKNILPPADSKQLMRKLAEYPLFEGWNDIKYLDEIKVQGIFD